METSDQDDSLMEDLQRVEAVEEWAGIDVVSWDKNAYQSFCCIWVQNPLFP